MNTISRSIAAGSLLVVAILLMDTPLRAHARAQGHITQIDASAIEAVRFDGPDFDGTDPAPLRVSDRRIVRLFVSALNGRTNTPEATGAALDTITLIPSSKSHRAAWEHEFSPHSSRYGFGPKFTAAMVQLERYRTASLQRAVQARARRVTAITLAVTTDKTLRVSDAAAIRQIVGRLTASGTNFTSYTAPAPSIMVTLRCRGDKDFSFSYFFTRPLQEYGKDPLALAYSRLSGH